MARTLDDFRTHVAALISRPAWRPPAAYAIGIATYSNRGDGCKVLDVRYPVINAGENAGFAALITELVGGDGSTGVVELSDAVLDEALDWLAPVLADAGEHPNARLVPVLRRCRSGSAVDAPARRVPVLAVIASLADAPTSAEDVFLRLHLLSARRVAPHGCNLEGLFGLLNNVVWTDRGPFDPDGFAMAQAELAAAGEHVSVRSVDKFPPMLDYVVPEGVRVADASRVRLGAHLAAGTTVMHEGFVNFNAGTLGAAMVEGRISAGVVVGDQSDIGGGSSIMGTLSGGGKEQISIGRRCLLGANGGIGISLGDDCVVEAGLYVTAGTIVRLPGGETRKARELSGTPGLLFRRNSTDGAVEALPRGETWQEGLNSALHSNG